jgi:hypothetical protein
MLWIHKQFQRIKLVTASSKLRTESIRSGRSEFYPQPSNRAIEERNKSGSSILTLLMGFVYEKILHISYAFLYVLLLKKPKPIKCEIHILIYNQQDATLHSLFYLQTALHVSGGTSTHHQKRTQLYLQHLVFVTPLLLPA